MYNVCFSVQRNRLNKYLLVQCSTFFRNRFVKCRSLNSLWYNATLLIKVVLYTVVFAKNDCNCYHLFQNIAIYIEEGLIICQLLRLKNKKVCQNITRLPQSFYFLKVKYPSVSICLFSISCYIFVETIFKMKLNTFVTKYMDILIFNIEDDVIQPQRSIMLV